MACPQCHRLLFPVDGKIPLHATPPPQTAYKGTHTPLPVAAALMAWCDGGGMTAPTMPGRRYARTQRGTVVHLLACRHIPAGTRPWAWADGRTIDELVDVVTFFGYRTCKRCDPLGMWG